MNERKYLVDEEIIRKTRDLIFNALVKNQRCISVEDSRDAAEVYNKCCEILKDAETETETKTESTIDTEKVDMDRMLQVGLLQTITKLADVITTI